MADSPKDIAPVANGTEVTSQISAAGNTSPPLSSADDAGIAETASAVLEDAAHEVREDGKMSNDSTVVRFIASETQVEDLSPRAPTATSPSLLYSPVWPPVEVAEERRPNLQDLPQEIRDEIYSYLLSADAVEYTPPYKDVSHSSDYTDIGGTAHTYRFETSLFVVNKAIREEARKYFLSQNSFTKFEFHCTGMRHLLHICDVPIVADHGFDDFDDHSFVLGLCWTQGLPPIPTRASINLECDYCGYMDQTDNTWMHTYGDRDDEYLAELVESNTEDPEGIVLIHERDLSKLWAALRLAFVFAVPGCPSIITQPGHQLMTYTFDGQHSVAALNLAMNESSLLHNPHFDRKTSFLHGLKTVTGAGYDLTLHGFDSQVAQDLRASMGPDYVWLRALQWDAFETLSTLKQRADELMVNGNLDAGRARYDFVRAFCDAEMHFAEVFEDPECVNAGELVHALDLDIRLSQVWLLVRTGRSLEALQDMKRLLDDITAPGTCNAQFEAHTRHLCNIATLLSYEDDPELLQQSLPARVHRLQGLPSDDYILHDIAILSCRLTTPPAAAVYTALTALGKHISWNNVLSSLSIFALPFRPFNAKAAHLNDVRPAGLKNWQDVPHLAQLTSKDKSTLWWEQQRRFMS